jgi:predicted nucleic acid-binding Zn ribbon protein
MADRHARPDRLGSVLSTVLQRVDPERRLRAYAVWDWWDEEVGDAIAQRAQPTQFRNGILFVSVASHTWMQELQFMKETIRERINARLGETYPPLIRDIFFLSGHVAKPAPANEAPPPVRDPRPEPPVAVLPSSGDARLDAVLARIMRKRAVTSDK